MIEGEELTAYLKSLAEYNEIKDITNTAFRDGRIKGETAKAIEIAKTMLAEGFDASIVAKLTQLTLKEIEELA